MKEINTKLDDYIHAKQNSYNEKIKYMIREK